MKISFIGVGHMATAMISGLLKTGFAANKITATNVSLEYMQHLDSAIHKTTDNNAAVANADVIILSVKPQTMQACLEALQISQQPLIISIAAGITTASLQQWLGNKNHAIVRCMPNMPALVNQGATALFANTHVNDKQRQQAETVLQAIGKTVWVKQESLIDVVTAIAGSAPAYYFYMMEALQQFAVKHGMDADDARLLIQQTCAGSGALAADSDASL
ncbi:MAG: pyrroline-5-carboxylate reductase, partial [Gammaproteobacteria bacterium]|nr:pyrroline-5-carboxylate reductase [Gammaproteobacteria bacterium]